jgi:uncharacterized protein YkwD
MLRPLLASAASLAVLGSAVPSDAVAAPDLDRALLREVNRARVAHHRGRLRAHRGLAHAATAHSRAMARRGRLAHAPDWARPLRRATPRARFWAENLAMMPAGAVSAVARRTVRAWLHSPPHRHNLLSPRIDIVGLGEAGRAQSVYVTADFADV